MKYIKPNFNREWQEAIRYPEFKEMGKDSWVDFASKEYKITNYNKIKDSLSNVNLDYDSLEQNKKNRFEKSFKNGSIEIPVVVKFSKDDYDLLGGNTRLAGLIKNGITPKLWVIDMTNKETDLDEKWSEKYKKSIDCSHPKGFSQRAHCQGRKKVDESDLLKGGLADNKSLIQIAKKHNAKNYHHIESMVNLLKNQLEVGIGVEMEHTDNEAKAKEIALDHLWEDPKYYTKLKQADIDETDASSSGAFSAPAFGDIIKRKITKIHNMTEQEQEVGEATVASSSGSYDVPLFGGTKGRKNPLSIGGPDTIYKGRAVKDKNFPKWGGPGGKFVKIKDKCKKFPYCNQGDINALELIESEEMVNAINEIATKRGLTVEIVKNIVLKEIKEIFI